MKKLFMVLSLFIATLGLTSCIGLESQRVSNYLDTVNNLYNEEYGIEFNRLYNNQSDYSGYITYNEEKIYLYAAWDFVFLQFGMYDPNSIEGGINNDEELFQYGSGGVIMEHYIFQGEMKFRNNKIVLYNFEGDYYLGIDEIVLSSR